MKQFQKLYEENIILDNIFDLLYNNKDKEIIEKNILELLVELGELANETRCFKYWSDKEPSKKEVIMDEYADCLIMVLHFCNMANIKLDDKFEIVYEKNIVKQFKDLYKLVSKLNSEFDVNVIKLILSNLINLGKLLGFTDEDIIEGSFKKINRNKERFNTGF